MKGKKKLIFTLILVISVLISVKTGSLELPDNVLQK